MKRCPQCYQAYEETVIFCENDGQRVLNIPGIVVADDNHVSDMRAGKSSFNAVAIGVAGMFFGALLCGGVYVAYSFLNPEIDRDERTKTRLEAQTREWPEPRAVPARTAEASPEPSDSPTPEEEKAEASPQPAQPQAETVATARLNRGPVSTGEPASRQAADAKVRTIIEMQDGSSVEVDAAWKDAQGVWYRRGGLVSFVESPRVKAITARAAEPKESPADNK